MFIRRIIPFVLIAAAAGVVFTNILPAYEETKIIEEELAELDSALAVAKRADELAKKHRADIDRISEKERETLATIVPDKIDMVALVNDIQGIAIRNAMVLRKVEARDRDDDRGDAPPEQQRYRAQTVKVELAGTYESFLGFLEEAERSLQLLDVEAVSFGSRSSVIEEEEESPGPKEYGFSLKLTAYSLGAR